MTSTTSTYYDVTNQVGVNAAMQKECGICYGELSDGTSVSAHTGEGIKHSGHKECLKEWFSNPLNRICPDCRTSVDPSSLITWKDRVITELKFILKDATNVDKSDITALFFGALAGGLGGLEMGEEATKIMYDAALAGGVIGGLSELISFIRNIEETNQALIEEARALQTDPIANRLVEATVNIVPEHQAGAVRQMQADAANLNREVNSNQFVVMQVFAGTVTTAFGAIPAAGVAATVAVASGAVALATIGAGPVAAAGVAIATGAAITVCAKAGYRVEKGIFNRHA